MAKKKAKTVKKRVVKKTAPVETVEAPEAEIELTEEQIEQAILENDSFQTAFFERLAHNKKFEIIPTSDEDGNVMSQEQLSFMKKEVNRLGSLPVYAIENGSRFTILICPREGKKMIIGMISNGAEVH